MKPSESVGSESSALANSIHYTGIYRRRDLLHPLIVVALWMAAAATLLTLAVAGLKLFFWVLCAGSCDQNHLREFLICLVPASILGLVWLALRWALQTRAAPIETKLL